MTDISWFIILLMLPFCLHLLVDIVNAIPRKTEVVIQERVRYKERIVYRNQPVKKAPVKKPVSRKKGKSPTVSRATANKTSESTIDDVLVALLSLGISKTDGKRLVNKVIKQNPAKTYLKAEPLLEDCIKCL